MGVPLKNLSDPPNPDTSVRVFYQNPAGLPQEAIDGAFKSLQSVYGPIAINAAPWPTTGPIPSGAYKMLIFAHRPAGTVGEAGGETLPGDQRAYVYSDQLKSYGDEQPLALEYATAHELGHTLGLGHTTNGIMAPNFTTESLERDIQPLSKKQLQRVEIALHQLAERK